MARLKAEDVQQIVRNELDRQERLSKISDEAKRTYERFKTLQVATKSGAMASPYTMVSEVEWPLVVQQVIDTYWEVVEEDLN